MSGMKKEEIITFKVDESLANAMQGIENRSEFIRTAILSALDSTCPLCKGSGILTPDQYNHWISFTQNHFIDECTTCHAFHIVCNSENNRESHYKNTDDESDKKN